MVKEKKKNIIFEALDKLKGTAKKIFKPDPDSVYKQSYLISEGKNEADIKNTDLDSVDTSSKSYQDYYKKVKSEEAADKKRKDLASTYATGKSKRSGSSW